MALQYEVIQGLSREALIHLYDEQARTTTTEGLTFLREEIFRRDLEEQSARMERLTNEMGRLTNRIYWLTLVITGLTLISTVAVIGSLTRGS